MVHCTRKIILPALRLHVGEHQLEAIAQGLYVGVWVLLKLKALRNHFHGPVLETRVFTSLEAKEEVTRVFGIDAEGIGRTTRVGLGVCLKPLI